MTPQEQLTTIISQILDDHASQIFDTNLHSAAGRQMIAALVARQMIDSPNCMVVDPLTATDEDRQAVDAVLMPDSDHYFN